MNAKPVFDTHFHIIDPRFPVIENQGFLPPVFTADDYRFPNVLALAERGHKVKATGFGRTEVDVPSALRDLAAANP
ncbi:MAG: hypothetical protein ACXWUH_19630, partial [Burkholderiales bacterium]